jgi:hypothetical protein
MGVLEEGIASVIRVEEDVKEADNHQSECLSHSACQLVLI